MSDAVRRGMVVVVGLLVTVGIVAAQVRAQSVVASRLPSDSPTGRSSLIPYDKDVAIPFAGRVPDVYLAIGDTVFPRCPVENCGSQTQTDVPVIFGVWDTAGTCVYGPLIVHAASLDSGDIDTVEFAAFVPARAEIVYLDTMATALAGDENPANDTFPGRITVLDWGEGHLTYNDGTFENAYSWVEAGSELAERFIAEGPLQVDKVVLWLTSFTGCDYDAEVRLYANDGYDSANNRSIPGTRLGTWVGSLHSDILWFFHMNEVTFDPPVVVDKDTFFVSYCQTSTSPAYPYLAVDTTAPVELGNDWGIPAPMGTWGPFYDSELDLGIDVTFSAAGIASEGSAIGRATLTIAPSPVSRLATVRYSLTKAGSVTLDVYDVTGRGVLTQTIAAARTGTATLDLRELQSGVYVVKVRIEGFSTTHKLIVNH